MSFGGGGGGREWSNLEAPDAHQNQLREQSRERLLLAERYPDAGLRHKLAKLLKHRAGTDRPRGSLRGQ